MKKISGFILAHCLFYLGDLISKTPNFNYSIYNNLMINSFYVQNWAGLNSPWKNTTKNT